MSVTWQIWVKLQVNPDKKLVFLENFLTDLPRGEPCIFSAISWLQDQAHTYSKPEIVETCCPPRDEELVRFWIYSHHIYRYC